jgi:hypothetical protein
MILISTKANPSPIEKVRLGEQTEGEKINKVFPKTICGRWIWACVHWRTNSSKEKKNQGLVWRGTIRCRCCDPVCLQNAKRHSRLSFANDQADTSGKGEMMIFFFRFFFRYDTSFGSDRDSRVSLPAKPAHLTFEGVLCEVKNTISYYCRYYPKGHSLSKHRQCICGVRASLEPHRTHVDGVKKYILTDLGRKKKMGVGSPYFSHGGSRRRIFFFLSFGVGWITQHFTYMRIRAPATATVTSPRMYLYSTVQHCTLCTSRRPSGSKNERGVTAASQ